jgi:CRP-like cAMP-binding protein
MPTQLLIRQIETVSSLTAEARRAISRLPVRLRVVEERRDIVREGQKSSECCLVLSGLVCRYKIVSGGRRQILSLHFAGDMPDLDGIVLSRADHSIATLTPATIAYIPHQALQQLASENPSAAQAVARQAMIDSSIFREWIANVGRRTAIERVAHLICECFTRMRALGLANETSFNLKMTQTEIGDATGLSNVHVNRTIRTLQRDAILRVKGKSHQILDWRGLQERGDFDPGYLHLLPQRLAV